MHLASRCRPSNRSPQAVRAVMDDPPVINERFDTDRGYVYGIGLHAVVQCKHWHGKAVGVKELREFFGVMTSHQLKRGTYATTSTYTADAQKFATDNGINAMDGRALLDLIAKRTSEQQQALLAVAFEGEYWRPTCASCGIKLVERTPTKGGSAFWGCSNYPRCKSRIPRAAAMR